MAGFCYFFPEDSSPFTEDGVNEDLLEQMHLPSLSGLSSPMVDYIVHRTSLEGRAGVWVYPKPFSDESPPSFGVKPDQEWRARGKFWIGWWPESPPCPEDLAREERAIGVPLVDPREQSWLIPIVTSKTRGTTMDSVYVFDAEGNMKSCPKKGQEDVYEVAESMFEYLQLKESMSIAEINKRWPEETLVRACVMIMGVNYRLGIHEVSMFHEMGIPMLDMQWVCLCLIAATDYGTWIEFKKKQSRQEALTSSKRKLEKSMPSESSENRSSLTAEG